MIYLVFCVRCNVRCIIGCKGWEVLQNVEGYKSGKVMKNDVLCSCSEIKVLHNGKLNYNYELLFMYAIIF